MPRNHGVSQYSYFSADVFLNQGSGRSQIQHNIGVHRCDDSESQTVVGGVRLRDSVTGGVRLRVPLVAVPTGGVLLREDGGVLVLPAVPGGVLLRDPGVQLLDIGGTAEDGCVVVDDVIMEDGMAAGKDDVRPKLWTQIRCSMSSARLTNSWCSFQKLTNGRTQGDQLTQTWNENAQEKSKIKIRRYIVQCTCRKNYRDQSQNKHNQQTNQSWLRTAGFVVNPMVGHRVRLFRSLLRYECCIVCSGMERCHHIIHVVGREVEVGPFS